MHIIEEHKRIYELIAKEIAYGVDVVEQKELDEWRSESIENKELYDRLVDAARISLWEHKRQHIDVDKNWKKLDATIHVSRRWWSSGVHGWRYAAIVILLLSVGITLFWKMNGVEKQKVVLVENIVPGAPKARLFLGDGTYVELVDSKKEQIIKQNGICANKDSTGLKYQEKGAEIDRSVRHKLVVPRGGEYQVILEDGTVVFLNSESTMDYPASFAANMREVYLEGEAYFRVSRDINRPFVVKTRNVDVRVLGTEFNIKAYQEEETVTTTLVKGAVSLAAGAVRNQVQMLKPNQQGIYSINDEALRVCEVDVNYALAWKNGQFIFRNERLEDIMTVLKRWYDFDVFYQHEALKDLVFAGKLNRMGTIDPILDIMRSTQKLTIQVKGKSIVLGVK